MVWIMADVGFDNMYQFSSVHTYFCFFHSQRFRSTQSDAKPIGAAMSLSFILIISLFYGQSLMLMMLWSSLTNPCKYIWMVNMLAMSFWIERNRGNRMAEQDATLFRGENNSIKRLFTISGLWKWRILIDDDIPSLTKGLTQIYYFARRNVGRRKSSKRADCKLTYLFYNLRTNGKRSEHGRGNIRSRTLYVFLHNINPT